MDEETLLDTVAPAPSIFASIELTPEERAFIVQALPSVPLAGNFAQLAPVMNMIESICNKLNTPKD